MTPVRRIAVLVATVLVAPVLVVLGTLGLHLLSNARVPRLDPIELPPLPAPRTDRRIAVVVTGSGGAEMTDFLAPVEVIARTGAFETYVVAPERRLVPFASSTSRDGGLDLVPHFSFDDYDQLVGRPPDLLVVPYLPDFASGGEPAVVPWIQRQTGPQTLLLSICGGAEVVAATGLLDGKRATTHPFLFDELVRRFPQVTWVRDVRFVENAHSLHSGAIASGLDASLAAVRRLVGSEAAERVARELSYEHLHFQDDPTYPTSILNLGPAAKFGFHPVREQAGVLLYDGVSELALGSVFDSFSTTFGYVLESIADERRIVVSRHGLQFVPRHALKSASTLDRVLLPGAPSAPTVSAARALADARKVELTLVHDRPGEFPYDGALRAIARHDSVLVAQSAARFLNYPTTHLALEGAAVPPELVVGPLVVSPLALIAVAWITRRKAVRLATTGHLRRFEEF